MTRSKGGGFIPEDPLDVVDTQANSTPRTLTHESGSLTSHLMNLLITSAWRWQSPATQRVVLYLQGLKDLVS